MSYFFGSSRLLQVRQYSKIAGQIFSDICQSIVECGGNSPEPRALLPLLQQAQTRGLLLKAERKSFHMQFFPSSESNLDKILLKLQRAEGMLKMLPKALNPFDEPASNAESKSLT